MMSPGSDPSMPRDSNGADASHHALVRPYMLTRGRTSSSLGVFELHAPALALITPEQLPRDSTPEARRIVAAQFRTPNGLVRI